MIRPVRTLLLACWVPAAWAQAPAPAGAPGAGEAAVVRSTVEDDAVRIDELRVRGQTRRLTVQPRLPGVAAYEVLPAEPGRAPERDPKAGQRVWWSFTF